MFRSRWSLIIPCLLFPPFFLAAAVIDSPNLADVLQKSVFLFTGADLTVTQACQQRAQSLHVLTIHHWCRCISRPS